MARKNSRMTVKTLIGTLLIAAAFIAVVWTLVFGVKLYLQNSNYFRIKKVTFIGIDDKEMAHRIMNLVHDEDNIFCVDIHAIRRELKIAYPQFFKVSVARRLPNELVIHIVQRKPVAQIELDGFFLIDNEGMVVSDSSAQPFTDTITIRGLRGVSHLGFGMKMNGKPLQSALTIARALDQVKSQLGFLGQDLATSPRIVVDVAHYPSIFVFLNDTLQIRFYNDDVTVELQRLMKVLPTLRGKANEIDYIDLRFAEPVVAFKKPAQDTTKK